MADRVGQQLGHYRLLRVLGQGAFAEVYLGEHLYLERLAAIKVLHVHMEQDTQEQFRREARTIAHLQHPHIVQVHDFGLDDQTPYLVMEYTSGGTLRARHPKGTQLPLEQIVTYVKQIASALDYAHELRVIHRDVKPENLLLNAKDEVVLTDFGLAVVQRSLDSLSMSNPAGTPLYMAPEQIQRHPCPASDQYALGILVYEWLAGEAPFRGTLYEVLSHHLHQAPPSLCARVLHLSPAVEDAVLVALAKDPTQRFPTVQDFATVLEEACFATQPLVLQGSQNQDTLPLAPSVPMSAHASSSQDGAAASLSPALISPRHRASEQGPASLTTPGPTIQQTKVSVAQRNRQALLRKVHSFWIEGVLKHSLHGAALLTLGLETQPDAVANPWHLVLQHPDTAPQPLPTGTRITQVYDDAQGELLILGAPGAGKTTLLLELARDLLARAQADEQYPMPVVFNLSSWAMKQQGLTDWLVEELNTKYQVPSKLAQTLLSDDQILPLLDGLDEVAPTARTACIEAINTYRREHGLLPLVVCSRQADYLAQSGRLLVRSAVTVQPLIQEQVDAYLAQGGEPLWALRVALHQDATLRELTSTPLLLSILTLTSHGKPVEELLRGTSLEERQRLIFEQYVKRMLTRRGPLKAGTPQQVVHWLSFLATRMREHNQTVFHLEHLQPDWLAPEYYRSYAWLAVRLPALLVGALASLVIALLTGLIDPATPLHIATLGGLLGWLFSRPAQTSGPLQQHTGVPPRQGRMHLLGRSLPLCIIVGLITGLGFGLDLGPGYGPQGAMYGPSDWLREGPIYGVVFGLSSLLLSWLLPSSSSEHTTASKTNRRVQRWKKLVHLFQTVHGRRALLVTAIMAAGFGLCNGLILRGSFNLLNIALSYGVSYGLISVLVSLVLETQAEGIFLTERLRWTWKSLMWSLFAPKHMGRALLITSIPGVIFGLINGLFPGPTTELTTVLAIGLITVLVYGVDFGLPYWILLGLFQGIESSQIEDRDRNVPNQGIRHSLHNSILMALISSGIIGGVGVLSLGLIYGLDNYPSTLTSDLSFALTYGLSSQMFFLLLSDLSTSLSAGLSYGLSSGWFFGLWGGLLACSMTGGLAALRHGILRLLLRRAGVVPRHYVRFLDEAASCILLQKVGGGYSFVHRLLLDYFAALENKDRM